jgi:hypothetical protein
MYEYIVQMCHIFSTKVGLTAAPIAAHSCCRCVRCGIVQKDGFGMQLVYKSTIKIGGAVMCSPAILLVK